MSILGAACVKELHQQVKCQSDKIAELEASNALLQQQITDILARLP
jgi:cell division protein FtsB